MNFTEALKKMWGGEKVRLSDWLGYWWMPTVPPQETYPGDYVLLTCIKVFTKNGDVLDSPNIDRYKDRDDWEVVTETGFTFDMALRFVKNGKRIAREGWNGKGLWVHMVPSSTFSTDIIEATQTAYLQIKSVNDTLTPWVPSQTDLLANDWTIVNG